MRCSKAAHWSGAGSTPDSRPKRVTRSLSASASFRWALKAGILPALDKFAQVQFFTFEDQLKCVFDIARQWYVQFRSVQATKEGNEVLLRQRCA